MAFSMGLWQNDIYKYGYLQVLKKIYSHALHGEDRKTHQ